MERLSLAKGCRETIEAACAAEGLEVLDNYSDGGEWQGTVLMHRAAEVGFIGLNDDCHLYIELDETLPGAARGRIYAAATKGL